MTPSSAPHGSSWITQGMPAEGPGGNSGTRLDDVSWAIAEVAAGRPVIVVDDADRENEGDIIVAASKMTPELMGFMIRHTSGVICVPLRGEDLDRLQLPLMTSQNTERMRTAFTISVDARDGVTTGISAADRARTVRALVDSATEPNELVIVNPSPSALSACRQSATIVSSSPRSSAQNSSPPRRYAQPRRPTACLNARERRPSSRSPPRCPKLSL